MCDILTLVKCDITTLALHNNSTLVACYPASLYNLYYALYVLVVMIKKMSTAKLPIAQGSFTIHIFHTNTAKEIAVLMHEPLIPSFPLVRIHSSCSTGDIFGSLRCDCGPQLQQTLNLLGQKGGLLIYLIQEGRGIGLTDKIQAYALQEQGYDTVDANLKLGHAVDARDYQDAVEILHFFNIKELRLLTNNPKKISALEQAGFIVKREPIVIQAGKENAAYLQTKQNKLGHLLP